MLLTPKEQAFERYEDQVPGKAAQCLTAVQALLRRGLLGIGEAIFIAEALGQTQSALDLNDLGPRQPEVIERLKIFAA